MTREPLTVRTAIVKRRRAKNTIATIAFGAALLAALAPLVAICFVVVRKGLPALSVRFLTTAGDVFTPGTGLLQGLVGSLYMLLLATALVIPIGLGAALYIVEASDERFTGPIRFFADVMSGVPSVFVGLFVYVAFVRFVGFGTLAGAIALAILMLPIVVRSSEEILKLVPNDLRRASFALGAKRWQTTMKVVLPAAGPGLVTGVMLAVARALGETAPLILTALGANTVVSSLQGQAQSSLTLLIFRGARSASDVAIAKAWAGALELMLLVLLITLVARFVTGRRSRVG